MAHSRRRGKQRPLGGSRAMMQEERREPESESSSLQTAEEIEDERRRLRRLQIMISMVTSVLAQDPGLTVEEASELVANARRAALALFPGKELAFDLIYRPRLQRVMQERFRLQ
ncbi:MAG TPA: hypothetical protein VNK82_13180 [Terriglobales bacterium]|nr:hypothetical protein [Terriglobales bacterium]